MAKETVHVACKTPNGLILRLFKQSPITEAVLGGGVRESTVAEFVGERVTIKGYSEVRKKGIDLPSAEAVYEITSDVDKEFITEWFKQNASNPLVKNKIILFHANKDSLHSMIRENEKRRCGFEALDPSKPLPGITRFDNKAAA